MPIYMIQYFAPASGWNDMYVPMPGVLILMSGPPKEAQGKENSDRGMWGISVYQ